VNSTAVWRFNTAPQPESVVINVQKSASSATDFLLSDEAVAGPNPFGDCSTGILGSQWKVKVFRPVETTTLDQRPNMIARTTVNAAQTMMSGVTFGCHRSKKGVKVRA